MKAVRIISWNINGIRSIYGKGFLDWLRRESPDILGLQETRAEPHQLPEDLLRPGGYRTYFRSASRKGYSGTALFSRLEPRAYSPGIGVPEFDDEGRIQKIDLGPLVLINAYFPNGSGVERDKSRVPYKLAFYRTLLDHVEGIRRAGQEVIIMGDYNTAHREIDLRNWKTNQKTSGFLKEERDEFSRWLAAGLTDTFRHIHGDVEGAYSWWSQRQGARERNVGWRIDYVLVSPGLLTHLRDAFILSDVMGSDHCPVGVELVFPGMIRAADL